MKRVISLVLVILMVLALGACGDNGSQNPNEGQNPDAGQNPNEGQSAVDGQALYEKYAEIIGMLENKDYQGAIRDITNMAITEQRGEVEKVPVLQVLCSTWYTIREGAPETMTFNEDGTCTIGGETMNWLAEESWSETSRRLQISKDGKICRYVSIETGNKVPYVSLSFAEERDDGIYSGEGIGTYYNHPLMPYLLRSWYYFNDYEIVSEVEYFSLDNSSASVNGDSCNWTLDNTDSQDSIVVHIDAKNEREGAYTATLTLRDGHPVMSFVDDATGESGLYYNGNSNGYEKTWPEYIYSEAMENYNDYLQDGSIWCELTDANYSDSQDNAITHLYDQFVSLGDYADAAQILENWDAVRFNRAMRMLNYYLDDYSITIGETYYSRGAQALSYAYSQFAELAGYAEADAILDRFTIVENKELSYSYVSVDHMGNEYKSSDNVIYEYNELGQVIRYSNYTELQRMYGGYPHNAFYTYDENGRVTQIKTGYTNDVDAIITPTYDDDGNKISDHVINNDGEFVITYTYDDQNRLVELRRPNTGYDDPENYYHYFTYTYDDAGRLTEKHYGWVNGGYVDGEYVYTYTYDAAGNQIRETETHNSYRYHSEEISSTYTNTAECVCDDLGNVIQKTWTYGNTVYSDGTENRPGEATCVYTYTYGDVYFFDATGMETDD